MNYANPESQEEYDAQVAGLAAEDEANRQAESDAAAAEAEINSKEGQPRYVTAEGKMRAVLEISRSILDGICQCIDVNSVTIENCTNTIRQIDEALAMKAPEFKPELSACAKEKIQQIIEGVKIKTIIVELPDLIKAQSSTVAKLTADIEKLRLSIANSKNQALELVLCATDGTKPKYGNDKARNLAVDQTLRDDKLYLANIDELGRKECELRTEQIELEHLHNLFRAYLAIAGMQGVR